MITLVTGGSKCGKSSFAERALEGFFGKKYYIAAMKPYGREAEAAIKRHRLMRQGKGFETIEKYTDIHELSVPEESAVLLECIPNLLANEMFGEVYDPDPAEKIIDGIKKLAGRTEKLVIVSGETGSDGNNYTPETMQYIKVLAKINMLITEISDTAAECVYGIPYFLKGGTVS